MIQRLTWLVAFLFAVAVGIMLLPLWLSLWIITGWDYQELVYECMDKLEEL